MNATYDRRSTPGVLLIAIGLVLLIAQWFDVTGAAALGSIAGVLLVMYVSTRRYGFLIPGMILGGLAVGVGFQGSGYDPEGGIVVAGLGAGFLAIFVVDSFVAGAERWWPLVPGALLVLVGATQIAEGAGAAAEIAKLWPLGLVLAGLVVLLGSIRARRSDCSAA